MFLIRYSFAPKYGFRRAVGVFIWPGNFLKCRWDFKSPLFVADICSLLLIGSQVWQNFHSIAVFHVFWLSVRYRWVSNQHIPHEIGSRFIEYMNERPYSISVYLTKSILTRQCMHNAHNFPLYWIKHSWRCHRFINNEPSL